MFRETEKIYNHHVPCFYLRAWANDNRIWWSGYGKIGRSELTVVGGENYFYKLQELTEEDVALITGLIDRSPEGSKKIHENFLMSFSLPPAMKRDAIRLGMIDADDMSKLDTAIANTNENYQTAIENSFRPYLQHMLEGDVSFYRDPAKAAEFLYGLSLQYFRTKKMREAIIARVRQPFENIGRVWGILSHMFAVNLGASLFVDRKLFKILLIDNETTVPFITGDQPIINLHGNSSGVNPPEKMELYYPLSPAKAMLLIEQSNTMHSAGSPVTMEEAHRYNRLIATGAWKQLFSSSEDSLKMIERASAPLYT